MQGLPMISACDRKWINQAILAVKGIIAVRKHKQFEEGTLKLKRTPLRYKANTRSIVRWWGCGNDWTLHEDYQCMKCDDLKLKQIYCPQCAAPFDCVGRKLNQCVNFSNIQCRGCKEITSAAKWHCDCGTLWFKCHRHYHSPVKHHSAPVILVGPGHLAKGRKRKLTNQCVDKPLPKNIGVSRSHYAEHIWLISA